MGTRRKTRQVAAFSLVEMIAVILIIFVLAGMVIGVVRYAYAQSYISRARCEMATMATSLENYKLDNGAYPLSGIGNVYTALAGGAKKYMTFRSDQLDALKNILDPFNKPYNYAKGSDPGAHNPTSFDLWSNGPDTVSGTEDDIVNWR